MLTILGSLLLIFLTPVIAEAGDCEVKEQFESWSATCLAVCVTLPQITAHAPPDRQPQSLAVSRQSTTSFQKALSESRQDEGNEAQPDQVSPNSQSSDATGTERSLRKADRLTKDASKKEDSGRSDAVLLVTAPIDQSKSAPLTGLLNLGTYQSASQPSGIGEKNPPSAQSITAAATPLVVPKQNDGTKKLGSFLRDGATSESTKGKAADRGQSMTVPLAYYPISLSGPGYPAGESETKSDSSSVVTNGVNGKTSSPDSVTVAPSVAGGGKSEPIIVSGSAKPEALAPALSPKTLAFAMRLGSLVSQATAAGPEAENVSPTLSGLIENNITKIANNPEENSGKPHSNDSSAGNGSDFGSSYVESSASLRPASANASFGDAASEVKGPHSEEIAAPAAHADPMRNVLLQLKADDNRRIDVRLVERGGELHVSVKSADPALTQRLQDHIPELTNRLDEERFNHDIWMPRLAETNRSESGSNSSNSFTSGNSGDGNSLNSDAGRRQHGNGQSRPDWVDLLENQLG